MKVRDYTLAVVLFGCFSCQPKVTLEKKEPGTTALLQAISIVDEQTVWLSGHQATFVRTLDGGESWEVFRHASDTLQFRDVHAFDKDRIMLMSAGPGDQSRIFEVKRGKEWRERFVMTDSLGFLDCMDFWDNQRGIAYGDAIDNYPYILLTCDGGKSWTRADTTRLPLAGKGEGGFAASGACVTTGQNGLAWIATGAGGNTRVLKSSDYGQSWTVFDSPLVKGAFAGHTAVDFWDDQNGFITGGDLAVMDDYSDNCAFSSDGGQTWKLTQTPVTKGAFYGGASWQSEERNFTFVCGPNGMDYTADFGQRWTQLDSANLWAVGFHSSGIGWASGRGGSILKILID